MHAKMTAIMARQIAASQTSSLRSCSRRRRARHWRRRRPFCPRRRSARPFHASPPTAAIAATTLRPTYGSARDNLASLEGRSVHRAREGHAGNPYDGYTLATVLPEIEAQIGALLSRVVADRGYRGHSAPRDMRLKVYIAGQRRPSPTPIGRTGPSATRRRFA